MAKSSLNLRRGKVNTLSPLSLSSSALQKTKYQHLPDSQASKFLLTAVHFLPWTPLCQAFEGLSAESEKQIIHTGPNFPLEKFFLLCIPVKAAWPSKSLKAPVPVKPTSAASLALPPLHRASSEQKRLILLQSCFSSAVGEKPTLSAHHFVLYDHRHLVTQLLFSPVIDSFLKNIRNTC